MDPKFREAYQKKVDSGTLLTTEEAAEIMLSLIRSESFESGENVGVKLIHHGTS